MGLLEGSDWLELWISCSKTRLPCTRRAAGFFCRRRGVPRAFNLEREVRRATLYGSALGLAEYHLNGQRVGDAYFEPGGPTTDAASTIAPMT